jgi:hypothetical protein
MSRRPSGSYIGGHTLITPGKSDLVTGGRKGEAEERRRGILKAEAKRRLREQPVATAPVKGEREADLARTRRLRGKRQLKP